MIKNEPRLDEFLLAGDEVLKKVQELLDEGKVRRVTLRDEEGHVLVDVPLLVGIAGAAATTILAPSLAAIGAAAALVTHATLVVEHDTHEHDASGGTAPHSIGGFLPTVEKPGEHDTGSFSRD